MAITNLNTLARLTQVIGQTDAFKKAAATAREVMLQSIQGVAPDMSSLELKTLELAGGKAVAVAEVTINTA